MARVGVIQLACVVFVLVIGAAWLLTQLTQAGEPMAGGVDLLQTPRQSYAPPPAPNPLCRADFTGRTEEDLVALGKRLGISNITSLMNTSPAVSVRIVEAGGTNISLILHFHPNDVVVPELSAELRRDAYGLLRHRATDRGTLLDIGGHVGTTALMYAALHPNEQVHTFEPAPMNFFYLCWNIVTNRRLANAITMHHAGVSADGAPFTMSYSQDHSMSARRATLGATFGKASKQRSVRVRTMQLATLLRECVHDEGDTRDARALGRSESTRPPRVGVVKLDCEGCEFDLVPSSRDFFLHGASRVMGEFHARHMRDEFMPGHQGNVSDDALKDTWRTLCRRPRECGDCIEWLPPCLPEPVPPRNTDVYASTAHVNLYKDPHATLVTTIKRTHSRNASLLPDVRLCDDVWSTGAYAGHATDVRLTVSPFSVQPRAPDLATLIPTSLRKNLG